MPRRSVCLEVRAQWGSMLRYADRKVCQQGLLWLMERRHLMQTLPLRYLLAGCIVKGYGGESAGGFDLG